MDFETDFAGPSWAHASGWAQLPGERRTVSCVVLGPTDPLALGQVLPELSDALTEAGYPWEVIAVDSSANAQVAQVLKSWAELPGFRRIELAAGTSTARLLTTGLTAARGDAVMLLSDRQFHAVGSIPSMISKWCEGMEVVRSDFADLDAPDERVSSAGAAHGSSRAAAEPDPAGGASLADELILLDRHAVDMLLNVR